MEFDAYTYDIKSDYDMRKILNHIVAIIRDNKSEIKSIRYSFRCNNCFDRIADYTAEFQDRTTVIKGYSKNCSYKEYDRKYNFVTERLVDDFYEPKLEEDEYSFNLILKTYDLFGTSLPISPYYPHEKDMDDRWNLYKRNKAKVKIREYDDKMIIAMPDFIDFMGLKVKYSALLVLKFK